MKARSGKRSHPFWPSTVMKKWLNIKPQVYDFSDDEVEEESEDDACSIKYERTNRDHEYATQGNQSRCSSRTSRGKPSKEYSLRHRRGKSETLRLQYINTKDERVMIGTWNVAGRLPFDDLEIDEWLCMQEPADVYILGFQEVVPLNAGNVLGAENRSSIRKWESIIRKTLNKSLKPETIHKSYSAPPSPILRTSSASDIIADVADTPILNITRKDFIGIMNDADKRTCVIHSDRRLDWPEQSLDATPQDLSSVFKLRRTMSSSARFDFELLENSLSSSTENIALSGCGLKRVHKSSGNLGLIWMDQPDGLEVLDSLSDESIQISGEEDDSIVQLLSEVKPEDAHSRNVVKTRPRYVRIVSKQMVGICVSVWVRRRLRRHVNNLKVFPVGIGLMGYMGNKGSVSVSMSLFQSRLCFVCSHLTSGEKDGAEQRRNSDVHEILRRTQFSSVFDVDQPQTIPSHDQVFWFGDLNYRINMLDAKVRKLVAKKDWTELFNYDQMPNDGKIWQLIKELRSGHVFDGWKEGLISFAPTYKYEINSDRYVGETPKEGEKKRSPAWCDRVLWLGKGIKQLSYERTEIKRSDHRPVSSMFLVEVEILDHRKLHRALNFSTVAVHPDIYFPE
ncbi:type I inositol polyphosphate 5-phosphatase 2-like isoform X1 [Olea europaea var. sylvestris]|uniref:type I inositol polyphosphate 5-phosphatase 2-like isoform X1 n=1 Tax=Olea europaea var. sylvestris TaxID=158386 RepID=UPI000C1D5AE7|nr:type I inositol polyphosphate 5-phosphatase 2-like isoform X1 [Olea europaea var. sylvestris]